MLYHGRKISAILSSLSPRRKKGLLRHRDFFQGRTPSGDRGFPHGTHAGEGRVITCEYQGFFLVNVYVPNAKGDLSRLGYRHQSWDPDLKDYLIELRQ